MIPVGSSNSSGATRVVVPQAACGEELTKDDEGIYIGWGCLGDDTASVIMVEDVKSWWKEYGIPKEIELRDLDEDEKADD
ncbi:hypothetical protein L484_010080 [Morus notabilis]|uniref:Uncharacterized protein n=1 Tax=Morus notabilis TaxID=981085 RepID=W9RQ44_9ROSA|nr:hypothetical protein L484_010080 [Morus notabilis]